MPSSYWTRARDLLFSRYGKRLYLPLGLVAAGICIGIFRPAFWTAGNINNVLVSAAFSGICACGMTILITAGLIDLSVAGVIAISAITMAYILPKSTVGLAMTVALLIGLSLGLVNGFVVAIMKIPPFIGTLGTLYLFLGAAFILTHGRVVAIPSKNFRRLTTGAVGPIPMSFIVFLIFALFCGWLLHCTYFGRHIRAIGSNEEASRLAGIPITRTKILAFMLSGIGFSIAAIFIAGRLASAEGNMSIGFEMSVIAAVVVGGTSMRGGEGTLLGTVFGTLLFAVLSNALNLFGVGSYWQYVLLGVVLICAIAAGNLRISDVAVRGDE
ncbi:ABC transporter permease [Trueperella sp. LYQ143]